MAEQPTKSSSDGVRALAMGALFRALAPVRWMASPVFFGDEHVPDRRPLLFVGNHTLYGMVDAPHLFLHLWRRHGVFLRSLGDHAHWSIPGWGQLLKAYGVVDGNRENCARLFADGQCVLVFPGGAREAFKGRNQRYQLVWRQRVGFAKMALEHGATIVPFAAVGADDLWDVRLDGKDLLASPLGEVVREFGVREDMVPPLSTGVAGTPIPKLQRFYFRFGPPVDPRDFAPGLPEDPAMADKLAWEIRERVGAQIEADIRWLQDYRKDDPQRSAGRRLLRHAAGAAGRWLDSPVAEVKPPPAD